MNNKPGVAVRDWRPNFAPAVQRVVGCRFPIWAKLVFRVFSTTPLVVVLLLLLLGCPLHTGIARMLGRPGPGGDPGTRPGRSRAPSSFARRPAVWEALCACGERAENLVHQREAGRTSWPFHHMVLGFGAFVFCFVLGVFFFFFFFLCCVPPLPFCVPPVPTTESLPFPAAPTRSQWQQWNVDRTRSSAAARGLTHCAGMGHLKTRGPILRWGARACPLGRRFHLSFPHLIDKHGMRAIK